MLNKGIKKDDLQNKEIEIDIVYQKEKKTLKFNFPYSFDTLISSFKKLFNVEKEKEFFEFSYDVKKKIKINTFFNDLKILINREDPIIYAEDSCEALLELSKKTIIQSQYIDNEEKMLNFEGMMIKDPFGVKTIVDDDDDINENDKIENNENEKVNMKESIKILENELRKTENEISEEKDKINLLNNEIEFLTDITDEKISKEFLELKNKITALQNENEKLKKIIEENNEQKNKIELNLKLSLDENNKIKSEKDKLVNEKNKLEEENDICIKERDSYKNQVLDYEMIVKELRDSISTKEKELRKKINKEQEMIKTFEDYKQKAKNPIIYVEDVTDGVFKLINENTVFESQNIGDGNNEINVIEFQGEKYLDPFKANKTIDSGLIMSNNVNDENNKIENSKNEEINIKESLKAFENELKKTEIKINEEIYTINLLKEEIEFLKDISNGKIPQEFPELKNKITTLQKENEEIKESNKIQIDKLIAENEMLKKKVEENEKIINDLKNKNNTIEELEKKNSQLKIEIELNRKLSMEEINDMKIENDNLIHETNKLKEENENNINEALNLKTVLDLVKGDLKKKEKELIEKKNKEEEMVKGFENYKKKVNEIKESFLNKIKELEEDNLKQNI